MSAGDFTVVTGSAEERIRKLTEALNRLVREVDTIYFDDGECRAVPARVFEAAEEGRKVLRE